MVNEATRRRIETVLADHLGPTFSGADIVSRPDNDGDPAIYIEARFDPSGSVPPSAIITDTMVALRELLLAEDDPRFPYLRPVYPEDSTSGEAA